MAVTQTRQGLRNERLTRIVFMTHLSSELGGGGGAPGSPARGADSTARRCHGAPPSWHGPGSEPPGEVLPGGPGFFRPQQSQPPGGVIPLLRILSSARALRLTEALWPGPSVSNSYCRQRASAVRGRPAYGGGLLW